MKLSLGQHLSEETNIKHIEEYHEQLLEKQKKLMDNLKHIETNHKQRPDYHFLNMTYNYSKLVIAAQVEWCRQTLKELRK